MKELLIVLGSLVIALAAIYLLAQAGEPQSKWIICELLELCE